MSGPLPLSLPLPEPAPRRHLHTRQTTYRGYLREDGLWDIEGELCDTKPYAYADRERGRMPPGTPVHHMLARLTVDDALVIRDAHFEMRAIPFSFCAGAAADAASFIGITLGGGWRRAVDERMRGTAGCSHLRELLYNIATAAFQTISPYREEFMAERGAPTGKNGLPFFLDQCYSWALTSPVVARYFPQFAVTKSAKRTGSD